MPGTFDATPPPAPPALLLAAFDTVMLGYRTRQPVVADHDDRILTGGGMLRPAVLIDGLATGTWRLTAAAKRRTVTINWFRRPAESAELRAEKLNVERFAGPG